MAQKATIYERSESGSDNDSTKPDYSELDDGQMLRYQEHDLSDGPQGQTDLKHGGGTRHDSTARSIWPGDQ